MLSNILNYKFKQKKIPEPHAISGSCIYFISLYRTCWYYTLEILFSYGTYTTSTKSRPWIDTNVVGDWKQNNNLSSLQLFPCRDRIYFSFSWIWTSPCDFFGQRTLANMRQRHEECLHPRACPFLMLLELCGEVWASLLESRDIWPNNFVHPSQLPHCK